MLVGGEKMSSILKANHIQKIYGTEKNQVQALEDVSLEIEEGTFVTIIGQSGSGKSTLLHVLGGLDKPDKGEVFINDNSLYQLKEDERTILRRRKIGFVFQFFNLITSQNVYENIVLPVYLDGTAEDENYINDLIETLGLTEKKFSYVDELSGGQQQRVAIARALSTKPSVIFLDEPTGNLDSKNSKEVIELLRISQKKYHQTIVMVTHDALMAHKSDRVITIEDGKIIGDTNE